MSVTRQSAETLPDQSEWPMPAADGLIRRPVTIDEFIAAASPAAPLARSPTHGAPSLAEFQRMSRDSERLPSGAAMIDLCEDRYRFLAAYAAAVSVGHTVLLPPSRAEQIIAEVEAANAGSYRIDDAMVDAAISDRVPESRARVD